MPTPLANILECSVDYFVDGEYTYDCDANRKKQQTLDDKIMDKLKYFDPEKKEKVLKIIEII